MSSVKLLAALSFLRISYDWNYIFNSFDNLKRQGNYRKVGVVDSNKNDDLAVIKLTTKGKPLPGEKSTYKPFVETLDDNGNPIRIGPKFISRGAKLSKKAVSIMKKDSFKDSNTRKMNRRKVRDMKGRK